MCSLGRCDGVVLVYVPHAASRLLLQRDHTLCIQSLFLVLFCMSVDSKPHETEYHFCCVSTSARCINSTSSNVRVPPSVTADTKNASGGAGIGIRSLLELVSRSRGGFLQGEYVSVRTSYSECLQTVKCCRFYHAQLVHKVYFSRFAAYFACRPLLAVVVSGYHEVSPGWFWRPIFRSEQDCWRHTINSQRTCS